MYIKMERRSLPKCFRECVGRRWTVGETAVRWPIQSESYNYREPLRKYGCFFLPFIFLLCILAVFTLMLCFYRMNFEQLTL